MSFEARDAERARATVRDAYTAKAAAVVEKGFRDSDYCCLYAPREPRRDLRDCGLAQKPEAA